MDNIDLYHNEDFGGRGEDVEEDEFDLFGDKVIAEHSDEDDEIIEDVFEDIDNF